MRCCRSCGREPPWKGWNLAKSVQRFGCATLLLGSPGIGLQRLLERLVEDGQRVRLNAAPVLRWCSHFATVVRDSPVMREISLLDLLSRRCNRRIQPIMSIVILLVPCCPKKEG